MNNHTLFPEGPFFSEIARVLKPGGILRVATPDAALLVERYRQQDWGFFLAADGRFILDRIIDGRLPAESILMHNRLVGWFASYSGRMDTAGGPLVSPDDVNMHLNNGSLFDFSRWAVSLLEPNRVYAHVNLYEYERLAKELRAAGLKTSRRMFNESASPYVSRYHIDREKHRSYSMYIEGVK
jgi:SAM-dependent methyltransferase